MKTKTKQMKFSDIQPECERQIKKPVCAEELRIIPNTINHLSIFLATSFLQSNNPCLRNEPYETGGSPEYLNIIKGVNS